MSDTNQTQLETLQILTQLKDLVLNFQTTQLQNSHPNPLNKYGNKCFSQSDEDGITLEIIRRLGLTDNGTYAEFGVGNGAENNTLILAALGWNGFWVGGGDLAFNYDKATKFHYIKDWITIENVLDLAKLGISKLNKKNLDVVSLDLDGNDIYFVEKLLEGGINPNLFIVEYNAKFIPPVKFQIAYNPTHEWGWNDYFGAALTNFVELFEKYGYKLICCNSHTGANAFFINIKHAHLFEDVPDDINDIYVPPRYYLYSAHGHRQARSTLEVLINK